MSQVRQAVGDVLAVCEIREVQVPGAGRRHYYKGMLRDAVSTFWECRHDHTGSADAQSCATAELWRRIDLGEVKSRGKRPLEAGAAKEAPRLSAAPQSSDE